MLAKVEWGTRRTCQGCATPFYDLQKNPIICPNCQSPYELLPPSKGRRGRHSIVDEGKIAVLDDLGLQDNLDLGDDLVDDVAADLIEDTDELGESLGDMSDVIPHDEEEH